MERPTTCVGGLSAAVSAVQLRVDSRWHPRQTPIHAMACPSAPPSVLGLKLFTNPAPLVYVASEGNEVMLYDLLEFKTKMKFNAWMPRASQPTPDVSPVAKEISDMQQAKLPAQVREGMRTMLPLPSGALICAGMLMNRADSVILTTSDRSVVHLGKSSFCSA